MPSLHPTNRRRFLASSIVLPTTMASLATGAESTSVNERIQVGVIGLGSRGYNLIDDVIRHQDKARIVAVCDVDQTHYRDRTWGKGSPFGLLPGKRKVEDGYRNHKSGSITSDVATYEDYRELIARADIDAVVIATPDHWHAMCTLEALRNGKDVYCEKPVTHLFAEGQLVYREVAKQKAVFQTGSQQRSDWRFRRVAELAKNGLLGKVREVQVGLPAGYDKVQADDQVAEPPKQLNYDFWCGPSPVLPYMRARHHRWWRGHRAYGGGVLMDWIGHHNDIAHWAIGMDQSGPQEVTAVDWTYPDTDIYDTPHHYTIGCRYDGGIESTISTTNDQGVRIIGSDGWVYAKRGTLLASDERWVATDFVPGDQKVYSSDDHMANFLDCVKSRQECLTPAETAHRSITPGHLAYVSQTVGRTIKWDPTREEVINDNEANKTLREMSYRSPWAIE